jgi:hypothetical protein
VVDKRLTLHTCHFKDLGGSLGHPCGKAAGALRQNGHKVEVRVAAVGRPFGIATTGRRPQVKALSGQEKLPVLELADGTVVMAGHRKLSSVERSN